MSNQRVVVLTDEKRAEAFRAFWEKLSSEGDPELINKFQVAFRAGFDAALEHPEGQEYAYRMCAATLDGERLVTEARPEWARRLVVEEAARLETRNHIADVWVERALLGTWERVA